MRPGPVRMRTPGTHALPFCCSELLSVRDEITMKKLGLSDRFPEFNSWFIHSSCDLGQITCTLCLYLLISKMRIVIARSSWICHQDERNWHILNTQNSVWHVVGTQSMLAFISWPNLGSSASSYGVCLFIICLPHPFIKTDFYPKAFSYQRPRQPLAAETMPSSPQVVMWLHFPQLLLNTFFTHSLAASRQGKRECGYLECLPILQLWFPHDLSPNQKNISFNN